MRREWAALEPDLIQRSLEPLQGAADHFRMRIEVPRHTALPDPSITQTAVRLPPISNPAYILIAALHSLLTNRQRRVSPTPESSNLMY